MEIKKQKSKYTEAKTPDLFSGNRTKAITQDYGTILGNNREFYIIQRKTGILTAKRAFGCAVRPERGDLVLYTEGRQGKNYILTVLERSEGEDATMQFPGNLRIQVQNGGLKCAAQKEIGFTSGKQVSLASPTVSLTAMKGHLNIEKTHFFGKFTTIRLKQIKLVSDSIDTIVERWSLLARNCYRCIRGADHLQSTNLIHRIKNLLTIRSKQSIITAQKDAKFDGERLHLG